MFKIDLTNKYYIKDGLVLIEDGVPQNGYTISDENISWEYIEELYSIYKCSIPSLEESKIKKPYFKALSIDELSGKALMQGVPRDEARENLELAILIGSLNGSLKWEDDKKWFWQSKADPDFIILKNWII